MDGHSLKIILRLLPLESRKKINAQDCAVFWVVCKAHPPVHISGYVLVDTTQQTEQRTSQMVYLFFAEALDVASLPLFSIFLIRDNPVYAALQFALRQENLKQISFPHT